MHFRDRPSIIKKKEKDHNNLNKGNLLFKLFFCQLLVLFCYIFRRSATEISSGQEHAISETRQ